MPDEPWTTIWPVYHFETAEEREARFHETAKSLLAETLRAIQALGYHVEHTTTNSDVVVKAHNWFTLTKIKDK